MSLRAGPTGLHWEPQRRIASLDALRGIAALAVGAAYFVPTELISRATIGTLLAHVFMVHTWVNSVVFCSINAVFWCIAVEVHFYLA